ITRDDAGYVLARTLDCPDDFWQRVYNVGGGPECRTTYFEFMERVFALFGMDVTKIFPRHWFAVRNFHCGWYADSDVLNHYTGHFRTRLEDYYAQVERASAAPLRWGGKLGGRIPGVQALVREVMRRDAHPMQWALNGEVEKVKAFFGSREAWERIGDWRSYRTPPPSTERRISPYEGDDWTQLAASRGGRCLAPGEADVARRIGWTCGFGHAFEASVRLIRAGHWCPQCAAPPWHWDEIARVDPLVASVWYHHHGRDEDQRVGWLHCPNE
ncbi:MAG TPA: hypothetical protein VK454_00635, partial [Myxococcaceae bacterium]|nr:hypothetical protein [Myxococcaceae bacterium]